MNWSESDIERIKALIIEGSSASEIAAELRTSRNAVIGICHRKGISLNKRPVAKVSRVGPRPVRVSVQRVRVARHTVITEQVEELTIPQFTDASDANPLHVTFRRLRGDQCRYPYGDELPYTYCGQPTIMHHPKNKPAYQTSWCGAHYWLVHKRSDDK